MKKKLFVEFYLMGIELAKEGRGPVMIDQFLEDVVPCPESAHQYAFYFARQCLDDIRGRNRKEWGMMGWLEWRLYRIGHWIGRLFEKKNPPLPIEENAKKMVEAINKAVGGK